MVPASSTSIKGEMMRNDDMRKKRWVISVAFVAALLTAGTLFASGNDGVKMPVNFKHDGYLANSMLFTKEPNNTGLKPGVHLIYVNPAGFDRLKQGGSAKY